MPFLVFCDPGDELSLQNMLLGELISRRGYGYGYELRDQLREFSEALGYSDTVVYASLRALERQGLVRVTKRDGPGGRSRQAESRVYYEVTDEGKGRFRDWMASIPKKKALREQLHMQLMAARAEDIPHLINALASFEQQCRDELRDLMEHPLGRRSVRGWTPGASLVEDGLIVHVQAAMEWAQRGRRSLVAQIEHPTGVPGRRRP